MEKPATKRLSLAITEEQHARMSELKKNNFYDAPWADLYRYVIERGLEEVEREKHARA